MGGDLTLGLGEDKEIETRNFSSKPEISRAKIFSSQISSKTLYFATKNSDGPFPPPILEVSSLAVPPKSSPTGASHFTAMERLVGLQSPLRRSLICKVHCSS